MLAQGGGGSQQASASGGGGGDDDMDVVDSAGGGGKAGIPKPDLDVMVAKWTELSKGRKGRALPSNQASASDAASFKASSSTNLHKSSGKTGITCVDVCADDSDLVLTGGNDKQAIVFSRGEGKMRAARAAGTKPVRSVAWVNSGAFVTGSADGTVKLFGGEDYAELGSVDLESPVVEVSVQPTGAYCFASTEDSKVHLLGIAGDDVKAIVAFSDDDKLKYSCGACHVDGLIYGAGCEDGSVRIWDLKKGELAGEIKVDAAVKSLSFAENGYYVAAGCEDGYARVFDLRKMKEIGKSGGEDFGPVGSAAFDGSVKMLAFCGTKKAAVVEVKKWGDVVAEYKGHKKDMTAMAWGEASRCIVTVGLDRALKQWS